MAVGNPTYGVTGLVSTTVNKYIPKLQEQIFTSKILLWVLEKSGSMETEPGGIKIVQPLLYGKSANVGSYSGSDVFKTDPNQGISAAEFPWRQYYGLMHFEGIEEAMNSGPQAVLNLIKSRMQQLELTMSEDINEMLYLDGSGNSNKDFYGLSALVSATDPTWGALGGVARADNEWWKSQAIAGGSLPSGVTTFNEAMRRMYNNASEGNDHPNILIGTQGAFERYEGDLVPNLRFGDAKTGDAGFQNLLFKNVPFAYDEFANAGVSGDERIWFLNTKYLHFKKLTGTWFKPSELKQPINQDVFYKHLKSYGNFVISNAKRQGVLTAVQSIAKS